VAYFEKRANGKVRVQVRSKGVSESKTFSSMQRAKLWAAQRESELTDISEGQIPRKTLGEAFTRYKEEVSPGKRGGRWEKIRLKALPSIAGSLLKTSTPLQQCSPALLAQWRDLRSTEVAPGTVLRELGLLSAVFQRAIREWGWMRENPCKAISKPPAPAHRDKVLKRTEIRRVIRELRRSRGSVSNRVALAFLFALRTGMRAGEICGIERKHVQGNTVTLPMTKNGTRREVPISRKADRQLRKCLEAGHDPIFGLTSATLDTLFRRARDVAGLHGSGVVFHSTRHTAATWMAAKVDVLTLCRIFGWKDPRFAMVYFNKTASDIAKELDK
jgi:integrase